MKSILTDIGGGGEFIAPMLAMIGLTILVWFYMFYRRISYMMGNKINPQKLDNPSKRNILPDDINNPAYNLGNLFELPVLFYALCALFIMTGAGDQLSLGLAWGFVAMRAGHSFIQCTYNRVIHRFYVYLISSLILFALVLKAAMLML